MTRRGLLYLLVCGLSAPAAFLAVGAAPAAAVYALNDVVLPVVWWAWSHPYLLLGAGALGVALAAAGVLTIGLGRGLDRPYPDELDDELARLLAGEPLLDPEASHPRGVRVYAARHRAGGQQQ